MNGCPAVDTGLGGMAKSPVVRNRLFRPTSEVFRTLLTYRPTTPGGKPATPPVEP